MYDPDQVGPICAYQVIAFRRRDRPRCVMGFFIGNILSMLPSLWGPPILKSGPIVASEYGLFFFLFYMRSKYIMGEKANLRNERWGETCGVHFTIE